MAEQMCRYETVFVADASIGEEGVKALVEKFKGLIESNGSLESVDEWGKRRLAYPINDQNEGYYTLMVFTSGSSFPAELDRVYHITPGVLRSLIVRK